MVSTRNVGRDPRIGYELAYELALSEDDDAVADVQDVREAVTHGWMQRPGSPPTKLERVTSNICT